MLIPKACFVIGLLHHISHYKKACVFMGFFVVLSITTLAQNQPLADSLERVYTEGKFDKLAELKILYELAVNHNDTEKKLSFSEELIKKAKAADSANYIFSGYFVRGNGLRLKGDLSNALESYFEAAKITSLDNKLGPLYVVIADVYSIIGNHDNAVNYYLQSIGILRRLNDSVNLASALLNAGDEYVNAAKLDTALLYTQEASTIYQKINSPIGLAYSLGNIGMVFAKKGDDKGAEANIFKAISILEEYGDYYPICVYLTYMSDIYLERKDKSKALSYLDRSLMLAKKYSLKEQISDANQKLSAFYESQGDYKKSSQYYKEYISYRDSVSNINTVQEMADLRTDFEVSRKQTEVDLLHQEKRNQQIIAISTSVALLLIVALAVILYRRNNFIKKTSIIINEEKKRSDNLLLNILPEETAQELKQNGKVKAKKFESVTVLFTDFKNFTHYATNLPPEELVETIDFYFSKFDEIMEKYGLEKIKTVGDSYMCVAGLPFPTNDHAHKMVAAAFEIAKFVDESGEAKGPHEPRFEIRIGINTGPVVAGVVGTKKFAYDVWGDTVNIASRMESNSIPGRINISENTYALIKDDFECEYRGEIAVKNRGMMKMYFVTARQ
jgi:class 3 adenylate cyclase